MNQNSYKPELKKITDEFNPENSWKRLYGYHKGFGRKVISCQRQVLASRRDKGCRFALPPEEGIQHVYACFKSRYTEEYSDSVYLGSWEN